MKTLFYKQLRLVCHPMTPVFCLFGILVMIPNYPYTVIFFYVALGLFFSFLNMREQKDLYYTALLPVPQARRGEGRLSVHGAYRVSVACAVSAVLSVSGAVAAGQGQSGGA